MNELEERSKKEYIAYTFYAMSAACLDGLDIAFEFLDKAFNDRDPVLLAIKYETWVPDIVKKDPRYQQLLDRIGFPEWIKRKYKYYSKKWFSTRITRVGRIKTDFFILRSRINLCLSYQYELFTKYQWAFLVKIKKSAKIRFIRVIRVLYYSHFNAFVLRKKSGITLIKSFYLYSSNSVRCCLSLEIIRIRRAATFNLF